MLYKFRQLWSGKKKRLRDNSFYFVDCCAHEDELTLIGERKVLYLNIKTQDTFIGIQKAR